MVNLLKALDFFIIEDSTIRLQEADLIGVMAITQAVNVIINNTEISENFAQEVAFMKTSNSNIKILSSVITNNVASENIGIFSIADNSNLDVSGTEIEFNSAKSYSVF